MAVTITSGPGRGWGYVRTSSLFSPRRTAACFVQRSGMPIGLAGLSAIGGSSNPPLAVNYSGF